jgi:drug/metabolite transporter (DMT)-like permease
MNTWLGILAILMWSTTIAFSRTLAEQLGTLSAAAYIYLVSGCLGTLHWLVRLKRTGRRPSLPLAYWLGCGPLLVYYGVALYLAIGLAANRQQTIEVGVVNYLWPTLTVVLSVPLQKRKARPFLLPAAVLAFAGIVVATGQESGVSWSSFVGNLRGNAAPYAFAFTAAISFGMYSNLAGRWAGKREGGGVPIFLLATGLVLAVLLLFHPEKSIWTPRACCELAYMSVFPGLLAYVFWERAMRTGNMPLVAALANLTPLISTAISCLYLGVPLGATLLAACLMVVTGAFLCKKAILEK